MSSNFGSATIPRVELDDNFTVMEGEINRRIKEILKELMQEGNLK